MNSVNLNPPAGDRSLLDLVYGGEVVVFSPRASVLALAEFAASMLEEAFAPHHPTVAQRHMPVEQWVDIFAPVKPAFIHHPNTMRLLQDIIDDLSLDTDQWFLDVPRLRGVTCDGYLTTGVGYAHHPHRDTWYSAPMQQINWWLPIYPYESNSSMAFHPRYFDRAVSNESDEFNYYEWNATGRKNAAKMIGKDTRRQPHATEQLDLDDVRVVVPVGGMQLFSGAQLHSTVANTTAVSRFSIDFRTVFLGDLESGRSAPNADSNPSGTSLRDFRRARDLAAMPDDVVAKYDIQGLASDAVLVFEPEPLPQA
jgi:hypothetical protein